MSFALLSFFTDNCNISDVPLFFYLFRGVLFMCFGEYFDVYLWKDTFVICLFLSVFLIHVFI